MHLIHHLPRMVIVRSLTVLATLSPLATQALNHPGGLQTQDALTNARTQVAAGVEPWKSAWDALEATDAQSSYTHLTFATRMSQMKVHFNVKGTPLTF